MIIISVMGNNTDPLILGGGTTPPGISLQRIINYFG
jgi:hypothetical protein